MICSHLKKYFFFQLKNAFDNLFEGLMESKDGEKEAAKVHTLTVFAFHVSVCDQHFVLFYTSYYSLNDYVNNK